jgi:RNA polymerase sigma-70 factor (ECF subfamily)
MTAFERRRDLLLLALTATHEGIIRPGLTGASPPPDDHGGPLSAGGPKRVSRFADRERVILANHPTCLDLGTEDGIRHAMLVYGPELRAFAARRLGSWSSAEDVVQEAMFRAWKSADRFDPQRGSVRGWLFSIVRNLLVDLARARARRPHTTSVFADAAVSDDTEQVIGSLTMRAALRRLSAEHRQVIYHCYLRERPHAEVAELLGIPIGTIRSRLFYARDALRTALDAMKTSDIDDAYEPDAA